MTPMSCHIASSCNCLTGTTSGLMGTWNDDVEDDLTAGDGTGTIPLNSTAEEIFDFGWTCKS